MCYCVENDTMKSVKWAVANVENHQLHIWACGHCWYYSGYGSWFRSAAKTRRTFSTRVRRPSYLHRLDRDGRCCCEYSFVCRGINTSSWVRVLRDLHLYLDFLRSLLITTSSCKQWHGTSDVMLQKGALCTVSQGKRRHLSGVIVIFILKSLHYWRADFGCWSCAKSRNDCSDMMTTTYHFATLFRVQARWGQYADFWVALTRTMWTPMANKTRTKQGVWRHVRRLVDGAVDCWVHQRMSALWRDITWQNTSRCMIEIGYHAFSQMGKMPLWATFLSSTNILETRTAPQLYLNSSELQTCALIYSDSRSWQQGQGRMSQGELSRNC